MCHNVIMTLGSFRPQDDMQHFETWEMVRFHLLVSEINCRLQMKLYDPGNLTSKVNSFGELD